MPSTCVAPPPKKPVPVLTTCAQSFDNTWVHIYDDTRNAVFFRETRGIFAQHAKRFFCGNFIYFALPWKWKFCQIFVRVFYHNTQTISSRCFHRNFVFRLYRNTEAWRQIFSRTFRRASVNPPFVFLCWHPFQRAIL